MVLEKLQCFKMLRALQSSQDEDDESEEADEDPQSSSAWNVAQENVPKGDATRRLAVMGCDWDHVAAGDLMVRWAMIKMQQTRRK